MKIYSVQIFSSSAMILELMVSGVTNMFYIFAVLSLLSFGYNASMELKEGLEDGY